jgi:hypothetical protein
MESKHTMITLSSKPTANTLLLVIHGLTAIRASLARNFVASPGRAETFNDSILPHRTHHRIVKGDKIPSEIVFLRTQAIMAVGNKSASKRKFLLFGTGNYLKVDCSLQFINVKIKSFHGRQVGDSCTR